MQTADEYRKYAQECIDSARVATLDAARVQFLDLAQLWLSTAINIERKAEGKAVWSSSGRSISTSRSAGIDLFEPSRWVPRTCRRMSRTGGKIGQSERQTRVAQSCGALVDWPRPQSSLNRTKAAAVGGAVLR